MRLQSHETEKDTDFQALSPSDYKLEGQTEKERWKKGNEVFKKDTSVVRLILSHAHGTWNRFRDSNYTVLFGAFLELNGDKQTYLGLCLVEATASDWGVCSWPWQWLVEGKAERPLFKTSNRSIPLNDVKKKANQMQQ